MTKITLAHPIKDCVARTWQKEVPLSSKLWIVLWHFVDLTPPIDTIMQNRTYPLYMCIFTLNYSKCTRLKWLKRLQGRYESNKNEKKKEKDWRFQCWRLWIRKWPLRSDERSHSDHLLSGCWMMSCHRCNVWGRWDFRPFGKRPNTASKSVVCESVCKHWRQQVIKVVVVL